MKATERQSMYENIEKHGNNLLEIFQDAKIKDPVKLCKKLHSLELKAHQLTTLQCNGEKYDHNPELCNILGKVKSVLNIQDVDLYKAVFVNGDARGYALKIDDEYMRKHNVNLYKDWGGYGIIAPDFTT